ncbi:MAG: LytR C-terminal domain-containing protein [Patulibacter minatonensis]
MVVASLIDSLSKIGAIGGIVSFVGVGLLILLLAAQSRQMRAMREWIDAEPERQAEASQRVIAEVQRRIAAARERRQAEAAGASVPPVPAAPRTVPPAPGTLGATPEARKLAAAAKGTDTVVSPIDPTGSVPPPNGDGTGGPKFAPLTPAGDAAAGDGPIADDLADPLGPAEPGQDTQPADALPDDYDPLAASTPAARGDLRFSDDHFSLDDYDEEEEHGGNRLLFGAGAAALVVGILIAGFVLLGGGKDAPEQQANGGGDGATPTKTAKATTVPATIDPASVRVMVLNGTQVNGLAQSTSDQLQAKGYNVSQPNTLGGQAARATTSVEYRPGSNNATKAKQVAKDLSLAASAVQPIEAEVSPAAPETSQVVVVTGQDLSSDTSGTTG